MFRDRHGRASSWETSLFTNARSLCFDGGKNDLFTDEDMVHLEQLPDLEYISLDHVQITDAGLVHCRGLTNLRRLGLIGTGITGAGLIHLGRLSRLQEVHLSKTQFRDPHG